MTKPRYTPLAQSLPSTVPFVGPETQERTRGAVFKARLGANENIFGPSPKAIEAMRAASAEIWKYGDPENFDLIQALAAHHGVEPANIMVGEGIDGLLGYLVRLLIGPGDPVVTSSGAYPTFNYHVAGFGGELHFVPYKGDHEDPAALFAKAAEVGAKLVYLANPDNPMGSWHSGQKIVDALEDLPEGCLLLLDEAYVECAPEGTAAAIDADDPRVIRMRTFSKAYGMAGARVGYALAHPELITAFNKVRNHFGMNRAAQAGALAALQDQDWLAHVLKQMEAARNRIAEIARNNGLVPLPSATNFVTIDCGSDGDFAKAVLEELVADGFFVRMPFAPPQNRCIRVSCGPESDLLLLEAALPMALERAGQRQRD
ncbi:histidinol-phosphate aminotransferase [Roseobacter sp. SK209-2-6]|uniref:pyridoxal phosphate-dependent aminotransferase n=1 Tax=Roseobacter sp. SK209-2-6 TaxID=388739 RepID=UPI0000F3EF81|nr:pyridoxal phosphate-dependent aminotransferase [Roseobacter sp. SK209-2-6]EBA15512.1 histidinol-phosphate aminotransferase [Roseobacter sp. SK209-2-6]